MNYHLALSRPIDLQGIALDAQAGKCPRHVMWGLSQKLEATVHQPGVHSVLPLDKMRAKLASRPEHWALARALSSQLKGDDLIFCTGEDVGIPVATLYGAKRDRPRIVVFIHNIDRPRGRVVLKLFPMTKQIDLFIACARPQSNFLRHYLRLPETRICDFPDQTDTTFFRPGPASPDKPRPIIVSVGLEKRDYRTLAAATFDLDVDVKISGFSRDASALAQAFPETMPDNMSRRFYEWPELLQLYRDADVVVVSLVDNKYAAGIQAMLEAMACQRPVVVTRTQGLIDYLAPTGIATVVNPGDPGGLRQAIISLLNNPHEAKAQAQRGHELVLKHHNSELYIENLATKLMLV